MVKSFRQRQILTAHLGWAVGGHYEYCFFLRVRTLIRSLAVRRCTVLRPIPLKTRQIVRCVSRL